MLEIFYLFVLIIMLLLMAAAVIIGFVSPKREANARIKNAKTHICADCLFNPPGTRQCVYIMEDDIDTDRPACKYFEEKKRYKPA